MERTVGRSGKIRARAPKQKEESGSSELLSAFQTLQPRYGSSAEAAQAAVRQLEELAASRGLSVDGLLHEAHKTKNSESHHHRALQLERQLAFFRR